jgi:hypothetical protein
MPSRTVGYLVTLALAAVLLPALLLSPGCDPCPTCTEAPTKSATSTAPRTRTPTATATPMPPTACLPSSSLGVLVQGSNVTAYIPNGSWGGSTTGVGLVQIEGTGTAPTLIATANVVNSCSSNSITGQTVCVANNTDVYLISGSTLTSTLTSGGSGSASFSGGSCTNCGVVFNASTNQAAIAVGTASGPGYQFLDLSGSPTFELPLSSPAGEVSEDIAIDPIRHFLLSPSEDNNYEVVNITSTTSPGFFENDQSGVVSGEFDSAAEDCSTGIALATEEFSANVFIADLTQATFTAGSPGTWTAPSQSVNFPEYGGLSAGTCGISVAGSSHIAVVTGEFGGNAFGVLQLPATSGSGTPSFPDYVACSIPNTPDSNTWEQGDDPHTVTAYVSPNSGDAIALLVNLGASDVPTFVAVIDLTKMLNQSIVPRITNGFPTAHTCDPSTDLETAGVLSFVAVP